MKSFFFLARFVLILAAAILFVAYRDTIFAYWERWRRPDAAETPAAGAKPAAERKLEYFCPMHPNVVRDEPGKCPICGMDLSERAKKAAAKLPEGVIQRVELSPYRVKLAGVATVPVSFRFLTKELTTVGAIDYDERRLAHITARTEGRIDELRVDFTGVKVEKSQPLARLYSQPLYSTFDAYLLNLERVRRGDREAQARLDSDRVRLRLWGVTDEQIARIEQAAKPDTHIDILSPIAGTVIKKNVLAGQYVKEGDELYTVADLDTVWVLADVFESEIAWVKVGQLAEITTPTYAGEIFAGKIEFVDPWVSRETRTVKVRIDVANAGGRLKPGMYVNVRVSVPLTEVESLAARLEKKVVYACPMHPSKTSTEPYVCDACGCSAVEATTADAAAPSPRPSPPGRGGDYWCPMHPEVTSDDPNAICTKCGTMKLLKRESASAVPSPEPSPPGEGGAEEARYVCGMHPEIGGGEPGDCARCGMGLERKTVHLVLAVPESAVIETGRRRLVYVEGAGAPGVFDAREVELGPEAQGFYPGIRGLAEGEHVVARGAFLIDAEARLSPGASLQYLGAEKEKP